MFEQFHANQKTDMHDCLQTVDLNQLQQDLGLEADCFISLVIGHSSLLSLWQENDIRENGQMITSIVFDVDDTIYDQQAPYRIAME